MSHAEQETATAVVLDYLAHGRTDEGRPRYEQAPLAHALGVTQFRLYELILAEDASISIGEEVAVRPPEEPIQEFRELTYDGLSSGAEAELDYAVEELIEANEDRFVTVFNEAQPITLRLHQLNLLPGIGNKLRDDILDARKRGPFADFADLTTRIDGLYDPADIIKERILTELRDPELKYYLFVGGPY